MGQRRILVIGSQCKALGHLAFLPQVAQDIYAVMTDPERGACVSAIEGNGLLVDPTVNDAKDAIRSAYRLAATDEATLFIAYIGHGEKGGQDFYLLPQDAEDPPDSDRAVHLINLIKEAHRKAPGQLDGLGVLVDACYSGSAGFGAAQTWVAGLEGTLRFEMLTAAADRTAANGCFSRKLVELLREGVSATPSEHLHCWHLRRLIERSCPNQVPQHPSYSPDETLWLARNVGRVLDKLLGLASVPCIRIDHLTDVQQRTLRLAINRLGEKGEWDLAELKIEFEELILADAPIEISGFLLEQIDQIVLGDEPEGVEQGPLAPEPDAVAVARLGDIFRLGEHRIICGDATDPAVLARLMDGESPARLVLTDEPYNVPVAGNVTGGAHREFLMASGEMSDAEFLAFNGDWMSAALPWLCDGGVFGTFDWRGNPTVFAAASNLALNPVNLVIWAKTNAGMGSLYRSQHELLPLFKKGNSPHVNNIELGKKGRWRSNVWTYPGASSFGSDARRGLEDHPTVKPTAMLALSSISPIEETSSSTRSSGLARP